jgi:hypothetical protein
VKPNMLWYRLQVAEKLVVVNSLVNYP